ncbi:MAG: hypothetical protein HOC71_03930, partial [Candidatus Latescibacteria bacterium]|nr:hypothetical protein [Candidatus Latescibacterota bacterium]
MKNKTPLILGSIFILLVIVFLITSYNPPDKSKGATQLFDGDKPTIDKIELMSMRNGHIVVEKINDVWDITVPFKYKASDIDV